MVPKSERGVLKRDIYRLSLLEGGFGTKLASRRDNIPVWYYPRGFSIKKEKKIQHLYVSLSCHEAGKGRRSNTCRE